MVPAAKNQKWLFHPAGCGCLACKSRPGTQEAEPAGVGEPDPVQVEPDTELPRLELEVIDPQPIGIVGYIAPEPIQTTLTTEVPAPVIEAVGLEEVPKAKYPRDPRFPKAGELSIEDQQKGLVARGHIAQYLYFRAVEPDITTKEVAERLGISTRVLNRHLLKARKEGWLQFEDPLERIEFEIVPKVIDNLSHFLDQQDKQVTIETAKGTIFKQYQESKGLVENNVTVLALKIEKPMDGEPKVVAGTVVGRGRVIEDIT